MRCRFADRQQVVPGVRPPEARGDLVDLMRVVNDHSEKTLKSTHYAPPPPHNDAKHFTRARFDSRCCNGGEQSTFEPLRLRSVDAHCTFFVWQVPASVIVSVAL